MADGGLAPGDVDEWFGGEELDGRGENIDEPMKRNKREYT